MSEKTSIRFFNNKPVRSRYDVGTSSWLMSAVDLIDAIVGMTNTDGGCLYLGVEDNVDIFKVEIYNYVWKDGKDEPVKQYDDVLDSLRYAIYSDLKYGRERTYNSR